MHFNDVRLIYSCFEICTKYVDDDDGDDCGIDVNERVCVFSAAVGIVELLLTRRVNYTNKAAHVTARNFFISFNSRHLASARVTDSIQTLVLFSKILPQKT